MALSSVGLGPGKEYYSAMEKTDTCMKSSFFSFEGDVRCSEETACQAEK